jgi:hypothetical protein
VIWVQLIHSPRPPNHWAYPRHWSRFGTGRTYSAEQWSRVEARNRSDMPILRFESAAAAQKVWMGAPYTNAMAGRLIRRFGL